MSSQALDPPAQVVLRSRAMSRLSERSGLGVSRASASAALRVLYELASSPDTATDALVLLHELQVHQIELEVQEEEMLSARAEVEAVQLRERQRHDGSPAGSLIIDRETRIFDLNIAAARLLGGRCDDLVGKCLRDFLVPHSRRTLDARLRGAADDGAATCALQLTDSSGGHRTVAAAVNADPAGQGFLIALIDVAGTGLAAPPPAPT